MLKEFEPRLYQQTILATAVNYNTLVVLPTGMGKTGIALMLASQRLSTHPDSKVLILAPTKPLVEQIKSVFQKSLDVPSDKIVMFTGNVSSEKRSELWKDALVIVSTPQGLENDIINKKIDLKQVSLLVLDEAHRATGDYSYVWLTKQYTDKASFPRVLALTASPGSDIEKITEVCTNLHIEEVEVRTSDDPDVKPYIQDVKIRWMEVELPEQFLDIKKFLDAALKSKLSEIKTYGYLNQAQVNQPTKTDILKLQGALHGYAAQGDKSYEVLKSMSLAAEAMKIYHALELVQSQGINSLYSYLTDLEKQALTSTTKAVQNLVRDINFRSALIKTRELDEKGVTHPKLECLKIYIEKVLKENPSSKSIIFSQYRDTVSKIHESIKDIPGVKPEIFVGQAKKKDIGMSQKQQIELLDKFRNGDFNVLVSSSVGEEGLDIPAVDNVIFYEPVPSAIRTIQRKGRTGRLDKGNVVVLCAKDTIDQSYRWSAHYKEKRMHNILKDFSGRFKMKKASERRLTSYTAPRAPPVQCENGTKLKLFVDFREKGNPVIKELIDMNVDVNLEKLNVGDYVLSNRVGIEYKKAEDFVNSILDGRLLVQVKELKNAYERPLFIVEGDQDIFSIRNIHPNAIRGMLTTIAISYGIPILMTKNFRDTAALLQTIAKREQDECASTFSPHGSNKPKTLKEQQEYIVSALPGVGGGLGVQLLQQFKTLKKVFNASEDELQKIDKIGEKKAKDIKTIVETEYI
ncbi:MAG: DEAD/DEAH box helicase [Candidatus Woesearchaeota archaeon]